MQDTLYDQLIDDCMLILKVTDRVLRVPKDIKVEEIKDLQTETKLLRNIIDKMDDLLNRAAPIVSSIYSGKVESLQGHPGNQIHAQPQQVRVDNNTITAIKKQSLFQPTGALISAQTDGAKAI